MQPALQRQQRAARDCLRNLRHNGGKIVPEAKGNEPFRHHKHRSEQQVSGIAHLRRLSTFK
jgi:hypothetical protein